MITDQELKNKSDRWGKTEWWSSRKGERYVKRFRRKRIYCQVPQRIQHALDNYII